MFFFFKQKTAYEMRISDWSSDVCSSDLAGYKRDAAPRADGGCRHAAAHGRLWRQVRDEARRLVDREAARGISPRRARRRPGGRCRIMDARANGERPRARSEEGRVGNGCVSPCSTPWAA